MRARRRKRNEWVEVDVQSTLFILYLFAVKFSSMLIADNGCLCYSL
jgi:hypothetical protein